MTTSAVDAAMEKARHCLDGLNLTGIGLLSSEDGLDATRRAASDQENARKLVLGSGAGHRDRY